jgi:hypothetical protein
MSMCLHPGIQVVKHASVSTALVGDTITYTFTVTNKGDTPLGSVTVIDPKCDAGTLAGPTGDTSADGKLGVTETWTYTCTHLVTAAGADPLVNVVTVAGTDSLGGQATDTDTVSVDIVQPYQIMGFFSPVPNSKWKLRQTVPIKFALADSNGVRLSDAAAAALVTPGNCRVKISAGSAVTVAPTCVKYDAVDHQFVFNIKLTKQGSETVTVTVSYPNTSSTTLEIGLVHDHQVGGQETKHPRTEGPPPGGPFFPTRNSARHSGTTPWRAMAVSGQLHARVDLGGVGRNRADNARDAARQFAPRSPPRSPQRTWPRITIVIMVEEGKPAPEFTTPPRTREPAFRSPSFAANPSSSIFYPRDDTPAPNLP